MKLKRQIILLILAVLPFTVSACAQTLAGKQEKLVIFPKDKFSIHTQKGEIEFDTEIASGKNMPTGLMYRNFLPEKSAMLFVFSYPQKVSMWMKNTKIPLDMLFMDETGKIIHIARDAKPESLEHISAGDALVSYVLEINAGTAKKYAINIGDKLSDKDLER